MLARYGHRSRQQEAHDLARLIIKILQSNFNVHPSKTTSTTLESYIYVSFFTYQKKIFMFLCIRNLLVEFILVLFSFRDQEYFYNFQVFAYGLKFWSIESSIEFPNIIRYHLWVLIN